MGTVVRSHPENDTWTTQRVAGLPREKTATALASELPRIRLPVAFRRIDEVARELHVGL